MESEKRIKYIDSLRGFALILVVLGHVVVGYMYANFNLDANGIYWNIYNAIYTFHMPLLMVVSGYLYHKSYFGQGEFKKDRFFRHLLNMVYVYILFSFLTGGLKIVFSAAVREKVDWSDLKGIFIRPIAPFWYIYILVIYYVVFIAFEYIADKLKDRSVWFMWTLFAGLAAVSVISMNFHDSREASPFEIFHLMFYGLFFWMGIMYARRDELFLFKAVPAAVLFIIGIGLCVYLWRVNGLTYITYTFGYSTAVAVCLIPGIWYVFERFVPAEKTRLLNIIGSHSLEIYVMHTVFTSAIRFAFKKAEYYQPIVTIVVNLLISLFVPLLIAIVLEKIKLHRWVFRPFVKKQK